MTPELKTACELVFQEHKTAAQPIKWHRDAFRGRISIGLSEMAKETLVQKRIILLPDKAKKVFTQLNPEVATAGSFEEAEMLVGHGTAVVPGPRPVPVVAKEYIAPPTIPARVRHVFSNMAATLTPVAEKWWLRPHFLYFVWPLCGAVGGVLLSAGLKYIFTELFAHGR